MFRRKRLPAELAPAFDAFRRVLDEIEPAKAGLTDIVPGSRLPGRPVGDAVAEFVAGVDRASALMAAWRRPQLETVWSACADGLSEARADATALLAGTTEAGGFGDLLAIVERLLDRLEPFADAEARFGELRRRPVSVRATVPGSVKEETG
jgi:hypothetical protein